jgi:hypothetical protein
MAYGLMGAVWRSACGNAGKFAGVLWCGSALAKVLKVWRGAGIE